VLPVFPFTEDWPSWPRFFPRPAKFRNYKPFHAALNFLLCRRIEFFFLLPTTLTSLECRRGAAPWHLFLLCHDFEYQTHLLRLRVTLYPDFLNFIEGESSRRTCQATLKPPPSFRNSSIPAPRSELIQTAHSFRLVRDFFRVLVPRLAPQEKHAASRDVVINPFFFKLCFLSHNSGSPRPFLAVVLPVFKKCLAINMEILDVCNPKGSFLPTQAMNLACAFAHPFLLLCYSRKIGPPPLVARFKFFEGIMSFPRSPVSLDTPRPLGHRFFPKRP